MKIKILFLFLLSVFFLNSLSAQKNSRKPVITGYVQDASKAPIVNAIVMIDGRNTNSITDSEGKYKVKVKRNASTIGIFTFGNGTIEEPIDGRTRINFFFTTFAFSQPSEREIPKSEEGVNTGYNHVKRKYVNTNLTKIDGSGKKYQKYSNIYDMILAECAGVRRHSEGLVIQESRNLWGFVPALLIVDGTYTSSIDYLKPSMVESISVLKGTSAAIYGSMGYGGAIVIKTKTGNK